jgi:hypothetical protein
MRFMNLLHYDLLIDFEGGPFRVMRVHYSVL